MYFFIAAAPPRRGHARLCAQVVPAVPVGGAGAAVDMARDVHGRITGTLRVCECGPITRAGRSLGRSCAIAQCPVALLRPALGSDAVVGCLPLIRSTTARIAQSVRGRSIGQGRVRADSRAWE